MSRVDRYEYKDWKGFGERTRKSREEIGLSKEKFSEMINRSENFVSDLEKGRTSASVHTVHQISKALKMTTDNLLYGENMDKDKNYDNREILQNIINRCDEEELQVIRDLIVAAYPNLEKIINKRKSKADTKNA